jgi:hypothetical protein
MAANVRSLARRQEFFLSNEMMRSIDLRLPTITCLFEILKRKDRLPISNRYPFTIGEARREILELLFSRNIKLNNPKRKVNHQ